MEAGSHRQQRLKGSLKKAEDALRDSQAQVEVHTASPHLPQYLLRTFFVPSSCLPYTLLMSQSQAEVEIPIASSYLACFRMPCKSLKHKSRCIQLLHCFHTPSTYISSAFLVHFLYDSLELKYRRLQPRCTLHVTVYRHLFCQPVSALLVAHLTVPHIACPHIRTSQLPERFLAACKRYM